MLIVLLGILMVKYLFRFIYIVHLSRLYLGGYPPYTYKDFLGNMWRYLMQTNACRLFKTIRYFVTDKFLYTDYYKRKLTYKQISRIV